MLPASMKPRDSWIARLQRLMPHRVREILLVSSRFDAFILEEDGPLTERLFSEYSELSLPWYPRIIHAANGLEARTLLAERRFDLVITTSRIGDTDVNTLGRTIKKDYPGLPVVLLTFSESDFRGLPEGIDRQAIDQVFLWSGDARILLAIHKHVEDVRNVEHDVRMAGVPVIVVVEDSVRHYSTLLTLLYLELVQQGQSLVAEGVNNLHKLLRLRTRPKVLLATTYEEAMAYYEQYGEQVVALVTDARFEREGVEDPDAGFALVENVRADRRDMPVLLASTEKKNAARAEELRVHFVDKNVGALSREIHRFVGESLGFGDFIFRLPDRREIARAKDTWEMERILRTVAPESLQYHASRHHFSIWLRARGMFHLAQLVRSRTLGEFEGVEDVRGFLVDVVRRALVQEQEGMVTDHSSRHTQPESRVVRLGKGSIGGKARGIAFFASLLARQQNALAAADLDVRIPKTIIIGTDEFDRFLEENGLTDMVHSEEDDAVIRKRFLDGRLPEGLRRDLEEVWENITGPLAVRSSSLLEDLQFQPFSGIYATYMLPNNHPDRAVRFQELCQAVKAVYASTYNKNARAYVASTPFMPEEEKMAVVIQEVVGQRHNERFYPHISGVALSHNYYPVAGQRAEDGVALLALGLGHIVVQGGDVLRVSPRTPTILPQYATVKDLLRYAQRQFYALDMSRQVVDFEAPYEDSLKLCDLTAAQEDGTLSLVASVYSPDDDAIRDTLTAPGRRVVTFNNVLKWNAIPLAPALDRLLEVIHGAMGCGVEIEFAVDMGDWGHFSRRGRRREPTLYVLQIRPLATQFMTRHMEPGPHEQGRVLCRTTQALGHGLLSDICDVVLVPPDGLVGRSAQEVAESVGKLDEQLRREGRPYLLIGPGRWGTTDPRLGVPVQWQQIAGAKVIVETRIEGRMVEPSQGTHFFQNITSLGIGYLTVSDTEPPSKDATGAKDKKDGEFIDLDWFESRSTVRREGVVRHVRLEEPLVVLIDGQRALGHILRPEESSEAAA